MKKKKAGICTHDKLMKKKIKQFRKKTNIKRFIDFHIHSLIVHNPHIVSGDVTDESFEVLTYSDGRIFKIPRQTIYYDFSYHFKIFTLKGGILPHSMDVTLEFLNNNYVSSFIEFTDGGYGIDVDFLNEQDARVRAYLNSLDLKKC